MTIFNMGQMAAVFVMMAALTMEKYSGVTKVGWF